MGIGINICDTDETIEKVWKTNAEEANRLNASKLAGGESSRKKTEWRKVRSSFLEQNSMDGWMDGRIED